MVHRQSIEAAKLSVGLGCMEQSSHGRIAILLTMGWGDLRVGHNGKRLLTAFNGIEMQESQEWACRRQEIVMTESVSNSIAGQKGEKLWQGHLSPYWPPNHAENCVRLISERLRVYESRSEGTN